MSAKRIVTTFRASVPTKPSVMGRFSSSRHGLDKALAWRGGWLVTTRVTDPHGEGRAMPTDHENEQRLRDAGVIKMDEPPGEYEEVFAGLTREQVDLIIAVKR